MSKSESEFEAKIGVAALELHKAGSEALTCSLSPMSSQPSSELNTVDYHLEGEKLVFASIESRNRIVALHVFKQNQDTLPPDSTEWVSVGHELWSHEIGSKDSAGGRLLALVHETHDIFAIAAEAITNRKIEVFDALNTVESALQYLKVLSPDGIWRLCEAQHEQTKNDAMAGVFFSGLGKPLIANPEICSALHDRLKNEINEATANLHPTVLVALAQSSPAQAVRLALKDADSQIVLLRSMALWTLGRLMVLSFGDSESLAAASAAITLNMAHSADKVRQAAILAAAGATVVTDVFVEHLSELGSSADQDALGAIAQTLWANLDEMKRKPYFAEWLRLLSKVPPGLEGILDRFDHILRRLLSDLTHQDLALSCLTEWVATNGEGTSRDETITRLFDTVTIELARRPTLLALVITDWMLAEQKRLASAAAGLLSYVGIHGLERPEFDTGKMDSLGHLDLLFLARRLLGFVFSENHLLSLAMSFFRTKDAPSRTFGILRSLLVDEIGYDYPYSTIETLKIAEASEERPDYKTFYSSIIEAISDQLKPLDALPYLVEFSSSPNLQRQFLKARSKQMERAMQGERKKSIIRQILTEVPIKAGVGHFSFYDGSYSEPSTLKSISHSVTLPRRHTFDTVGAELRLWHLSNAKRDDS